MPWLYKIIKDLVGIVMAPFIAEVEDGELGLKNCIRVNLRTLIAYLHKSIAQNSQSKDL